MKKRFKSKKYNIRYIVVHMTGTKASVAMKALDEMEHPCPYHYIITRGGRLVNLRPLLPADGTIEVALLGGLDREGSHVDTRTEQQSDTLFNTLMLLSETYPEAKIVGADEVYVYGFANPGFNVRTWLYDYIPAFLLAA